MEDNKEIINEEIENVSEVETTKENDAPVYSQMSLEYVSGQISQAKKKGRIQGALITGGIVLAVFVIYLCVSIGIKIANGSIYATVTGAFGGSILDSKTVKKIDEVYKIIENTYIEEYDKDKLREGMIKGMVDALDDPYSVYYNEEEYAEMMESSSGQFEGIGAYLSQDPANMQVKVVRPIKNSPAEEAGIIAEDIIVEVDGENVEGEDINVVVSKVRGPEGTKVNVGIYREGESEILYFDVTRAKIDEESVEWEMKEDNIGYIYISSFEDATGKQFVEGYDALIDEGMTSLIIDLRTNGGGYVDTSVEVADRLVKEGIIVSIKDRRGLSYAYEDAGDDKFIDIPCVVLVDGNTASASEILTGCLKDYELVTIIGTKTFGKGIVQDVLPLGDGTGLKVTSAKYYTPNGENIHKIGIEPDIVVEWDYEKYKNEGIDNQLEAAINYLKNGTID